MSKIKDSNGNVLSDGDAVAVIKDIKIKGSPATLKRGTIYRNIRLTGKPDEVECRSGKATMVLKTMFIKKV